MIAAGSTVPLWQSLVLALAAALGGGLLGTWARISYERTAELRSRMIQAADEFATAWFRTIAGLRDAPKTIQDADELDYVTDDEGDLHPDIEAVIDTVTELADGLQERFARVQLLFGIPAESAAARRGQVGVISVRNCINVLRMRPRSVLWEVDPDDAGRKTWNENFSRVVNELDRFSQAARREIRAGNLAAARRHIWNGPVFHRLRVWRALWRRHRLKRRS